jgi:hypothetical protein
MLHSRTFVRDVSGGIVGELITTLLRIAPPIRTGVPPDMRHPMQLGLLHPKNVEVAMLAYGFRREQEQPVKESVSFHSCL